MQRWPLSAAHPDCWGLPWKGTVLAPDDPRAWAGTLAFPRGEPEPEAVRAHLARHPGLAVRSVPVLWEFGQVDWERREALRPYLQDVAAWEAERRAAFVANTAAVA
jgi:hypothetical protein